MFCLARQLRHRRGVSKLSDWVVSCDEYGKENRPENADVLKFRNPGSRNAQL